ncbi:MAG TPA: hypothetical protein PLU72_07510 [Candidatus Ozemobacteraceae bacterium]|nr:hypothetical protein [Candidatus Ozemobacteraceae bacterium]
MPMSLLKTLGISAALAVAFAGACAAPAAAVTPDVRLPAWHALEVRVSDWDPAKGEIGIDANLRALDVPLQELAAEIHWPKPVEGRGGRRTAAALPAGQLWSTRHSARGLTIPFDGWIELEMLARPDADAIRRKIEGTATYAPAMRQVMMGEVAAVKAPLPIGRNLALYTDKNIAVLMPEALVFQPVLKAGSRVLHLWMPDVAFDGSLRSALGKLRACIAAERPAPALDEAIKAVDEAMGAASDTVEISFGDGRPSFAVPLNVFRDGMTMNRAVLAAAREPESAIALGRLERLVRQAPNFATAFGWANVGVLQAGAGLKDRARDSFSAALELIPAWPLVRGWQKELEKGK